MKKPIISRRDVLQGSTALAASSVFASVAVGGSAREPRHAATDRGRQEGRQGRLLHLDRPAGGGAHRQDVRGEIPGHSGAGGAHRRRARVPAHRPGICKPDPRRRRGQFVRCRAFHRVEARRHSRALRARGRGQVLSRRAQGSGRHVRDLPRLGVRHRLQHQPGEGRGCAQELCRPARSEMDRQDRQGASEL